MVLDYVIKPERKYRRQLNAMSHRLIEVADWQKLASDADYEPVRMACQCSVSLWELKRFFHKRIGESPAAWVRYLRC